MEPASGAPLITNIEVRSVLTPQRRGGIALSHGYTINPYRGCAFSCKYCYATKFVHDPDKKRAWGQWVEVKQNAVDALRRDSHKLCGARVFFSSATDPYQPVEKKLGLTRALLEVLLASFPAKLHLQTRSPHVVRDIDLLRRFGDSLTVGISVPTDSDVVRRAFEPRAPAITRRLDAARQLREAGIRTTAMVAPLLPCTPRRLAKLLAPCFDSAWVDALNFYEKADELRAIYDGRGWERFLRPDHEAAVRAALTDAGLMGAEGC